MGLRGCKMSIKSKVRKILHIKEYRDFIYNENVRQAYLGGSVAGGTLYNKNVLITGATGGIGEALAMRFLVEGCNVCLVGRNESKLKKMKDELMCRYPNTNIIYKSWNNMDVRGIICGVDELFNEGFGVDICINNAGICTDIDRAKIFRTVSEQQFREVWDTNYMGTLVTAEHVAQKMEGQGRLGVIINISSITADFNSFRYTPYGMSKCAVAEIGRVIEDKYKNIVVKTIKPGSVATNMNTVKFGGNVAYKCNKLNHAALPEEIASVAAFLCSSSMLASIGAKEFTASACEVL